MDVLTYSFLKELKTFIFKLFFAIPPFRGDGQRNPIEIELSQFQLKLLQQLAIKRGCSARKMAYTALHFMLKAQ